ncbi:MAG: GDP-mannose 4,6-dehydratase [Lamprobacter sp.]|uniref:GDP-mannose 4,6-dehydratase n=1 Tax=Lamprobacter sp. TaxID=3100796 RepID=UPI002B262A1D|nr:GDP-mannose 4,6-dehydratase [Lamprobacter sp.]MEA3642366.1 GDP-mannose 4,6-dehydratase [Lamprobacter sp.]
MLGARVVGVALPPNTQPALFDQLGLADRLEHYILDIRDRNALAARVLATEPDILFHLAAQPLVRLSYSEPVETYATILMGTVHLLDALRLLSQQSDDAEIHVKGRYLRCLSLNNALRLVKTATWPCASRARPAPAFASLSWKTPTPSPHRPWRWPICNPPPALPKTTWPIPPRTSGMTSEIYRNPQRGLASALA